MRVLSRERIKKSPVIGMGVGTIGGEAARCSSARWASLLRMTLKVCSNRGGSPE